MAGQHTPSPSDTSNTPILTENSLFAIPSAIDEKIQHEEKLIAQRCIYDSEGKKWGLPVDMTCEPVRRQICLESSPDTNVIESVSDIEPSLAINFPHGGCMKIWRNIISKQSLELTEDEMLTNVVFRRCEYRLCRFLTWLEKHKSTIK